MSAALRLFAAAAAFALWLVLLFTGRVLGGAVHLLFPLALALVPWRDGAVPPAR